MNENFENLNDRQIDKFTLRTREGTNKITINTKSKTSNFLFSQQKRNKITKQLNISG